MAPSPTVQAACLVEPAHTSLAANKADNVVIRARSIITNPLASRSTFPRPRPAFRDRPMDTETPSDSHPWVWPVVLSSTTTDTSQTLPRNSPTARWIMTDMLGR